MFLLEKLPVFRKIDTPCHLVTFLKIYTVGEALASFVVLDIIILKRGVLIQISNSKHLVKTRSPYYSM